MIRSKQMRRAALGFLLAAAALTVAGCGEEKKYNSLKQDTVNLTQEWKDHPLDPLPAGNPKEIAESRKVLDEREAKLGTLRQEVNKNLTEMEKLAGAEDKMMKDFLAYKPEVEGVISSSQVEIDNARKSLVQRESHGNRGPNAGLKTQPGDKSNRQYKNSNK